MDFFTRRWLEGRTRLPVRLVVDTAQSPLGEGVRRRGVISRHLLYQAENLFLDLRIERDPRGPRAVLVGQVADLGDPLHPIPSLPVLLLSESEILVSTGTNRHGEFQMIVEPHQEMQLCLPLRGERLVQVTLDRRVMERLEGEPEEPA